MFLGHRECGFIRCRLFRAPAKHQTKGDILSRPQKLLLSFPFTEIQFLQRAVQAKSRSGELESFDLFCDESWI